MGFYGYGRHFARLWVFPTRFQFYLILFDGEAQTSIFNDQHQYKEEQSDG